MKYNLGGTIFLAMTLATGAKMVYDVPQNVTSQKRYSRELTVKNDEYTYI